MSGTALWLTFLLYLSPARQVLFLIVSAKRAKVSSTTLHFSTSLDVLANLGFDCTTYLSNRNLKHHVET